MMRGKYKIFYALQTLLLFLISSSLALAQGKIAFSRPNPVTGWTDIYIGDVDAEKGKIYNIRNFTNFMAHDFYPTWSPDGSKIAFVSDRSGKSHAIYIADYKGENIRLLLSHRLYLSLPELCAQPCPLRTAQEISQVRCTYLAHSPCLLTPVESHSPHHNGLLLLPAIIRTISTSTSPHNEATQLQDLLTARVLSRLRLNLISRLRLQGWIPAVG